MKNDRVRYLVVGNSTAAIGAVEAIRRLDPSGTIRLLSREPHHVYSRPLIPMLLEPDVDLHRLDLRPRDFYEAHGVDKHLGLAAERLDPRDRTVWTREGPVPFETLLLACGGKPFRPAEVGGLDACGVFSFTGWDDAVNIRSALETSKVSQAVVVGGGLIGIKAAEALRARGIEVTLVELADRVLPLALDARGSRMAAAAIRKAGVELLCGTTATCIEAPGGRASAVRLRNGACLPCGLVVMAIGVAPNADLAAGTDIRVDRGIVVDDRCETSVKGIYAAGDVAQGTDALTGASRPIPIFPNAFWQGTTAGTCMAGGEPRPAAAFAMNAVEVFGLPTISVGLATASGEGTEVLTAEDEAGTSYKRIVLRGNRVVGALFVGDVDRAGIYTGLIRDRVDVGTVKPLLTTDEFGLLRLPQQYRKHLVLGEGIEA